MRLGVQEAPWGKYVKNEGEKEEEVGEPSACDAGMIPGRGEREGETVGEVELEGLVQL